MAKQRGGYSLDSLVSEPKTERKENEDAPEQVVQVDEDKLTEEEKELYNRCFDTGITSIIQAIVHLGAVRTKKEFIKSLLRGNFALCDMMIEERRKYIANLGDND